MCWCRFPVFTLGEGMCARDFWVKACELETYGCCLFLTPQRNWGSQGIGFSWRLLPVSSKFTCMPTLPSSPDPPKLKTSVPNSTLSWKVAQQERREVWTCGSYRASADDDLVKQWEITAAVCWVLLKNLGIFMGDLHRVSQLATKDLHSWKWNFRVDIKQLTPDHWQADSWAGIPSARVWCHLLGPSLSE